MYIDTNYFLIGPVPANAIRGVFNNSLVGLTYFIAVITAYVGLNLIEHLRAEKNTVLKIAWHIFSATVIGAGIWSMHFIGMMAYQLPVPVEFDLFWTIESLAVAIISVGIALCFFRRQHPSKYRLFLSGIVLSIAIIITHYSGMEGLEVRVDIVYLPSLFLLSIVVAFLFTEIALWIAFLSKVQSINQKMIQQILSAMIMAVAMFGMYYISMKSALFLPRTAPLNGAIGAASRTALAILIAEIIGFTFFIALIVSQYRQLSVTGALQQQQLKYTSDLEKGIALKTEDLQKTNSQLSDVLKHLNEMQSQLLQSEKMATVGQLAAGIAHEINNPLSYVVSNIAALEKRISKLYSDQKPDALKNNDIPDIFHETEEGLSRIQKIVNSLKIFSNNAEGLTEKKNINVCIESAIALSWNALKNKCTLHKNFNTVPDIFCNSQQIEVVFVNLLINAAESIINFGEITITSTANASEIQVSITDNGSGISLDNLPHIFEPFFTTKLMGRSSGLGLTLSYNIIKIHGGVITVDSALGKGSTFTVYLPIR